MPPKALTDVRKAFTDLELTPTFADEDYRNANSQLQYICRCGKPCVSTYRRIRMGMDACKDCANEKRRQTNQERYGVDAPLQNADIKEAARVTNQERYGADTPLESVAIQLKIRETVRSRYGVDHALQSPAIHDKTKATIARKYGVKNPTQHRPFHLKQQKSAYRLKEYTLPSGVILEYQGYEHYCLTELLEEGISSEELLEGYQNMPTIAYTHEEKQHVYHPDIFICQKGDRCARLIEVKSSWTLKAARSVLVSKLRAAAELGYSVELRVYDIDGTRLGDLENDTMCELTGAPGVRAAFAVVPEINLSTTGLAAAMELADQTAIDTGRSAGTEIAGAKVGGAEVADGGTADAEAGTDAAAKAEAISDLGIGVYIDELLAAM